VQSSENRLSSPPPSPPSILPLEIVEDSPPTPMTLDENNTHSTVHHHHHHHHHHHPRHAVRLRSLSSPRARVATTLCGRGNSNLANDDIIVGNYHLKSSQAAAAAAVAAAAAASSSASSMSSSVAMQQQHTRARSRTREYGRNRHIGGGSRGGGSHGYSLSVVDIKDYMVGAAREGGGNTISPPRHPFTLRRVVIKHTLIFMCLLLFAFILVKSCSSVFASPWRLLRLISILVLILIYRISQIISTHTPRHTHTTLKRNASSIDYLIAWSSSHILILIHTFNRGRRQRAARFQQHRWATRQEAQAMSASQSIHST